MNLLFFETEIGKHTILLKKYIYYEQIKVRSMNRCKYFPKSLFGIKKMQHALIYYNY